MLMESQIWHPPASSMALSRVLFSSSRLDARHFSSSLYATRDFQGAIPVLQLRGSESKSVCAFFERNILGLQKFLPQTRSLLGFAVRTDVNLSSWHLNAAPGGLVWSWDSSLRRYHSRIFVHYMWTKYVVVGPDYSTSLPVLLVWRDVISFIL